ncbi:DUF3800 domain-containing protein [Bifidobacterium panos]|uniref:DUF3800 domain-containing protein n=1 Tax=Bifidobacterium panos TaxID=2675321 RepID=A0ABX1SUH7_9BIFI|nr:DUF3800 domain-containing protein [Bifidobacterium sp. DSM 109963]NMN01476.1 hypothetical protein [Bifidobacterium sp. DSM 109963]
MNIFVYADESGVFDQVHNDFFVFGGLIFLNKKSRDIAQRRYISAEREQRKAGAAKGHREMKAVYLSNKQKAAMFRAMNHCHRFGVVVRQRDVLENIYQNKKSKQRYLDYVFKMGLKSAFKTMIRNGEISCDAVNDLFVFMDEHSTATDGRYELGEALENEFKIGTYNYRWEHFFPPLFPGMGAVNLQLKDSCQDSLVRAADITANRLYYAATSGRYDLIKETIDYITLP